MLSINFYGFWQDKQFSFKQNQYSINYYVFSNTCVLQRIYRRQLLFAGGRLSETQKCQMI